MFDCVECFETNFSKENTMKIDGFDIGTTNNFTITEEYIRERFDEFNSRYFDTQLNLNSSIEVKVYPYKNTLGSVTARGFFNKKTGQCNAVVVSFHISNYFSRSEYTFCNTILHEMIHMYQYQVLNVNDGHGYNFQKKMKDINTFGWGITIIESPEEKDNRGDLNQDIVNRETKKQQKQEQDNNLDNYILAAWIPQNDEVIKGDTKISFHILEKDLPEDYIGIIKRALNFWNATNPRDCYLFSMVESSKLVELLKREDLFDKRYRLSKDYLLKKIQTRSTTVVAEAVLKRTYCLPFAKFKAEEEEGMIKSLDNKKLPPVEYGIRESVNLNLKIDSAKDFINTMEQDPYIDILHAKDIGGFIEFESVIS